MRLASLLIMFVLVGVAAHGDEPGPQASPPPQNQCQGQNCYYAQCTDGNRCGNYASTYNPGNSYYCAQPCNTAPQLPYPPNVVLVPVPVPSLVAPPVAVVPPIGVVPPVYVNPLPYVAPPAPYYNGPYYNGPYYGRPYYGVPPGVVMPRPGGPVHFGGFRRMSLKDGCEVQQGNNGQFVVLSKDDQVLYTDSSEHASENAEAMKQYYEQQTKLGLCHEPWQNGDNKSLDI